MFTKPKILAVDDRPQNLVLLERLLGKLDVDVFKAVSGNEALGSSLEHDFCVALVDVQMPDMDGYELVELMRSNESTANLPVIFVSAIYSDEYHHRKGYDAGAVDFLSKPFNPDILLSKVQVFIDLYLQRQKLQTTVDQLNQANAALGRRAMQLEISSKVGQQVTSILKLDALLPQVVELVESGFGYTQVAIWLVDEEVAEGPRTGQPGQPATLTVRASSGGHVREGQSASLTSADPVVQVCRTGNPYLSNTGMFDSHAGSLFPRPTWGLALVGSELALPLRIGHIILGVLDIQCERARAFGSDDFTALQIIADQVAIAIRNANLYSQVVAFNQQLEALVEERTEELHRAYQTLERLDKTKSDFITVAAHELRTPLTLIRGYASMLEDMVDGLPGAPEMVRGILTGEGRLFDVVNSMLDISKIDNSTLKAHKEPVSLGLILTSLNMELNDSLAERQLRLILDGLEDLPLVEADSELMHKLFLNLVLNAIKYTPDGGQVAVSGSLIPPGALIDPALSAVRITVSDTGIGIDPSHHELIFEKFFQTGSVQLHSSGRTKFKGGGPGLGLAIARGIVNVHGGRIWVESAAHDEEKLPGSAFHVLLPLKHVPPSLPDPSAAETPSV